MIDGAVLNFTKGATGNKASPTNYGNTYHITGIDNGRQRISKPFTIDGTCP
jgi:hypothetical protein